MSGRISEFTVEFVKSDDLAGTLNEYGIDAVAAGGDDNLVHLHMADGEGVVHLHFADDACEANPREGAESITVAQSDLPGVVEHIIHRLHIDQVVLIPSAKWRGIFDAVAFSLAENEDWQAIDAAATVELNTRDPLLCEPGDYHTLGALIAAIYSDAESEEQSLAMTAPAAPILMEIVPGGALRISVGNEALADEVRETARA